MLTCSSPPGQGGALHAGGGARAATAAPGPAAAAQPIAPAWPEAGGRLTWRGAERLAALEGTPHLEQQEQQLKLPSPLHTLANSSDLFTANVT